MGFSTNTLRAGVEKILGDLEMQRCRGHDAHGIDVPEQFAIVGVCRDPKFGGHRRSRLRGRIGDAHQVRIGQARIFLRVKPAQIADADHGGAHQGGASRRHLLRAR